VEVLKRLLTSSLGAGASEAETEMLASTIKATEQRLTCIVANVI